MTEAWQKHRTKDLIAQNALVIGDGYRAKNIELSHAGLPFARAGNIDNGFHFADADRFPRAALPRVGEKVSRPGDVVFTSKGTVGRFAFVPEGLEQFVYSPQLCYWRSLNTDLIHPRFLFYWMQGYEFRAQIHGLKGQTDMADYVSLTDQRQMSITLPPIVDQRAIAHILGTLDDKIELNRQLNHTLEAIARAIFKSWFVDFDPVWANMEGRPYPLEPDTLALFPDTFEDSVLGKVPTGWRVKPIGDVVEAVGGGTPSTKEPAYWEGGTHYFATPKDMSSLSTPILLATERKVTDEGLAKISSGLLPAGTVLMSSRAPVGYLALAAVNVCINQGFIAIKPNGMLSNYYVLNWLHANMPEIQSRASGTTFPEISKRNFRPINALVPSPSTLSAFDRIVGPLYEAIESNLKQADLLADLRDTLLPKLISGELRVPAAAETVEEVAS